MGAQRKIKFGNIRSETKNELQEDNEESGASGVGGLRMRVYLDNCCFNRPFDDHADVIVALEAQAKLQVQRMMHLGSIEYVWPDILSFETSRNPYWERRDKFMAWRKNAVVEIAVTHGILERGRTLQSLGLKHKDALHVASAEKADCDWFLTTDKGILKKVRNLGAMRIGNPMTFIVEEEII